MRVLILGLLAASLSQPLVAAAQTSQPPAVDPSQTTIPAPYVLKAGTQLVVVDVTVTDRKHAKVHGLKASDFILKENGKPQRVTSFEEHFAAPATQVPATAAHPQLPAGQFTNYQPAPPTGSLNVILVDQTNTALKDQLFERTQLIEYLKHARPDARTAIFGLSNNLILLQGFTSDPALLLAALTRRGEPKDSFVDDDVAAGASPVDAKTDQILSSALGPYALGVASLNAPVAAYQEEVRAYVTLGALNDLAHFLESLPGRKNLIWFAGNFPSSFFPSANGAGGPADTTAGFQDLFRSTVNLLSRAQVAIYPVDAQGLRTDQSNSAVQSNGRYAAGGRTNARSGPPEVTDLAAESSSRSLEHLAMNEIAHDTGGVAYYDHNDLDRAVREAVDDGSSFYTLTYAPGPDQPKSETFHSVAVQVTGGPYNLSYRRGYFTGPAPGTRRQLPTAASAPHQPTNTLTQALRAGAPPATDVLLRVAAYPVSAPDQPTPLAGNQPNPNAKLAHGPYRVYEITGAAAARAFSFTNGPNETYSTSIDFITDVYDLEGHLINVQSNTARVNYTKARLLEIFKSGMHFTQTISVPAKGEFFLRLAVRDQTSQHTGSLEIPVADIASLTAPADLPKPSAQ